MRSHPPAILEDENNDLPELVRNECRDLCELIGETTTRIDAKLKRIKAVSTGTETTRRL